MHGNRLMGFRGVPLVAIKRARYEHPVERASRRERLTKGWTLALVTLAVLAFVGAQAVPGATSLVLLRVAQGLALVGGIAVIYGLAGLSSAKVKGEGR